MKESIRGFADAVLEDAAESGDATALADELTAVAQVVDGSPDLRLVLADPGLATHVRRSVVDDLFGSRVSDTCLRLLSFTLEADRPNDVPEDLTWLDRRGGHAREGQRAVPDGPLGRTAATERVDGYASAVLHGKDPDELGDIEDDLFRFSRVVLGSDQLLDALSDPALAVEAREGLVRDLLSSKVGAASSRLAIYAVRVGRPRDLVPLLDALVERVAEESQHQVAEVRAVVELTDDQQRRLAAALGRILGHDVDVRVVVDPSVLGGFVASVGDSVVDGSVRHRLEQLRDRLVLPDATITL